MNIRTRLQQVFLYMGLTLFCHGGLVAELYSQRDRGVSLKEAFKGDFLIGTAVNARQLDPENGAILILNRRIGLLPLLPATS